VILAIVALANQKDEVSPTAKASPTPSVVGGIAPLPTGTPIPTPSFDPSLTPTPDPGLTPTPDPGLTPTPEPSQDPNQTDGGFGSTTFSGWSGGDGFTVILKSASSQDSAEQFAGDAEAAGHAVGILESDDFSSLNGGYWVVFSGEYTSKSEAQDALDGLKSDYSDAYVKAITPQ
jgi:septal ring-binding cell division protein DamX